MVRRIAAIVLVLLGAVAIVLGVLSATAWRTSDVVSVTSPAIDTPLVVVDPGVPTIVTDSVDVTVTAASPEQAVTVIEGRDVDVAGWIGDVAHQRITGLPDWDELSTQVVEGVTEVPSPVGNDMWLTTQQGTGELTFTLTDTGERTALLIPRDGATGPAPTVTFTWTREVATPYRDPLVGGGIAGIVVGLALGAWSIVAGRRKALAADVARIEAERVAAEEAKAADPESTAILAPTLARQAEEGAAAQELPEAEESLTRRQRRALAAAASVAAAEAARREAEAGSDVAEETSPAEPVAEELVPVEDIATAITAPAQEAGAPDTPDAYPSWLRTADGEEGTATDQVAVEPDAAEQSAQDAVDGTDEGIAEADGVTPAVEAVAAVPASSRVNLANLRAWRRGKSAPAEVAENAETSDDVAQADPSVGWAPQTAEPQTAEPQAAEAEIPDGDASDDTILATPVDEEGEHLAADASAWRRRWGVTSEPASKVEPATTDEPESTDEPGSTNEEGQN